MSQNEIIRLNEIIFCRLFKQLLTTNTNPIKVYTFVESVANLVNGNITILNSVIAIILSNDRRYMPTKQEFMYLLRKADIPVRRACKLAGLSQTTYYSMAKEMCIQPKFTPIQYEEMLRILKTFDKIGVALEGSIL